MFYSFQKTVATHLQWNTHVLYCDDMGLGKSFVVINTFPNKKIVYVGNKTGIINFEKEILKWKPEAKIYNVYKNNNLNENYDYFLFSYHKAEGLLSVSKNVDIIVFDEVHNYFKNSRTLIYQKWYNLLNEFQKDRIHEIIFLTGTPIVNSMKDLDNLYRILLRNHYEAYKHLLGDPRNIGLIRRTKEQIIKREKFLLPNLKIKCVINTTNELYHQLSDTIRNFVTYFTKLKLYLVSPRLVNFDFLSSDRIDYVVKTIKQNTHKHIVVFSYYIKVLNEIKKRLDQEVAIINGKMSHKKREQELTKYNQCKVLLATTKTGGESLNLPQTDIIIFTDLWWTYASFIQAINRAHRLNSKQEEIEVIFFFTPDTIENLILEKIQQKAKLSEAVNYFALKYL